jgi:hypothetical protein
MKRQIFSAFAALTLSVGQAGAQDQAANPVVVELFTSQGCSSCPPADEFVAQLAAEPSIIVLTLHVDYWDYIGWADTFADPQFTDRQKAYAREIGSRTIYTPQFIVGGLDRVEGNKPAEVTSFLMRHMGLPATVAMTATRSGDVVTIRAQALKPLPRQARVQLVRYSPSETVTIERGENAGETVNYHNVVTSWTLIGEWDGRSALELGADMTGSEPGVIILQSEGPREILAAARIE